MWSWSGEAPTCWRSKSIENQHAKGQGGAELRSKNSLFLSAAKFWSINHLAFSKQMGCLAYSEVRANSLCQNRKKLFAHVRSFQPPQPLERLSIVSQDCFLAIDGSADDDLLLLDPPYLDRVVGTTKSRRHYSCGPNWGLEEHKQLRSILTLRQKVDCMS